jgi:hypothetical protein
MKAGRQSPPIEEQHPKQGSAATASGKVERDDKNAGTDIKKKNEEFLEGLPSNPESRKEYTSK